jgi:surfeit locus 1 family protein
MLAGYSFRPRAWALATAAAACAAGIALGNWQARRADEKRALGERLEVALRAPAVELPSVSVDPKQFALRRVAARGRFVAEHTVYLYNKLRRGRVGYEVLTPLRISNSESQVLVNRGWTETPQAPTPQGEVRIEGIALERLPRVLQLKESTKGGVRQTLDIGEFAAETGLRLQPIVIEQHSDTGDGLARDWPRPDAGIEKHQSYAVQWYSLAALAVALALVFSFRRIEAPSK